MIIRFVSTILTEEEDDLSYSLEFVFNDESILGFFSLFLLALDIL